MRQSVAYIPGSPQQLRGEPSKELKVGPAWNPSPSFKLELRGDRAAPATGLCIDRKLAAQ